MILVVDLVLLLRASWELPTLGYGVRDAVSTHAAFTDAATTVGPQRHPVITL